MDLKETLLNLLKGNEKYYSAEQNKLLLGNIFIAVNNHDPDFFKLLFCNELMKRTFFSKVDDFWIFNDQKFIDFINLKDFMPDSFTSFKNKIGLVDNKGSFLDEKSDVVLSFPYKDCLLVGSQDKDDQKSTEVLLNETLALDDINRLLQPKAFVNMKRYSKEKVDENITFNEKDNLIIKGNNLIALSTILSRYRGKVKCIYIDPPYNTGNDSFNYNDRFNHSTWLTFMKNRLELAKELLRDDGVIFVQCDDNEQAYLKVLMDGVFGRDNFIGCLVRKTTIHERVLSPWEIQKLHDYILIYAIHKRQVHLNRIITGQKEFPYHDNLGEYYLTPFQNSGANGTREARPNLYYPIYANNEGKLSLTKSKEYNQEILPAKVSGKDGRWLWSKDKFEIDNWRLVLKNGKLYDKRYKHETTILDKSIAQSSCLDNEKNSLGTKHLSTLIGQGKFQYPKSEELISKLLNLCTNVGDIVLDFHLGSGTTAAVAHKMNRQYIGIEQMDYIESVTVERLKKVIEGEQGGISKIVDWNGGGSFVYCELAKKSQKWIDLIAKATKNNIGQVKEQILSSHDIIPYLTKNEVKEILHNFDQYGLDDQKQRLISIINKNKLYVNYSEIDDESNEIKESEKDFTISFYGEKIIN